MSVAVAPPVRYSLTTEALASLAAVKPATVRVRYCRSGSYFGLIPLKLKNGRLMWPQDAQSFLADATRGKAA